MKVSLAEPIPEGASGEIMIEGPNATLPFKVEHVLDTIANLDFAPSKIREEKSPRGLNANLARRPPNNVPFQGMSPTNIEPPGIISRAVRLLSGG